MTQPASDMDVWQDEGRRAAAALDSVGSAIVVGRDADAVARVALGIARVQAERRRVAVADLIGEVPPLQSLVDPDADPHGISDSFLYGVSLNKIAHPVDASGNLFVLPSGSEAVAVEDVFRSDRWRRLASGFREVGALLLLVSHADTPGLDALITSVDGIVIAGDASGALADAPPPLAVVAPVRRRPVRTSAERAPRASNAKTPAAASAGRSRRTLVYVGLLALMLAGALSLWVYARSANKTGAVPVRADSARRAAPPRRDSLARPDSAAPNGTNAATSAPVALTVANPGDSTSATGFSVDFGSWNTAEGANAALDPRTAATFPVIAVTPVVEDDGLTWFRVMIGALGTRAQGDSLLQALRRRGVLGDGSGMVVRTPYALLVADSVPMAQAQTRMQSLSKQQVPVYALSRGAGVVALYAGAFERPEQAAWLAGRLRAAGVAPTLVYRTGSSLR